MRIYVAAPYSAPTSAQREVNAQRAIDAAIALMDKGHVPFVPHLSHFIEARMFEKQGVGRPWEFWMAQADELLQMCDALLYLDSSPGADIELARAKDLCLEIYYAVEDVPAATSAERRVNGEMGGGSYPEGRGLESHHHSRGIARAGRGVGVPGPL